MISLKTATKGERSALENLMQLYAYDWSEILSLDVDADGRFAAIALDSYWVDAWRHPLLIRVENKLAGFALVLERSRLTGKEGVFDMAEFFVMRNYRRKGVGLAVASVAFDRFQGPWEVRQKKENSEATAFWRRAIGQYTRDNYQETFWNTPEWVGPVQTFISGST